MKINKQSICISLLANFSVNFLLPVCLCWFYGVALFKLIISYEMIISLCEFSPDVVSTIVIVMSILSVIAAPALLTFNAYLERRAGKKTKWTEKVFLIATYVVFTHIHIQAHRAILEANQIAKAKHIEILFIKDKKSCKFSSDSNEFSGEACGIFDDLEKKIKDSQLDDLKAKILERKLQNKDGFLHTSLDNETYRATTNNEFDLFALQ